MEIGDGLRQKMHRLRMRESELQREKEELQHFARQELAQIDGRIDELTHSLRNWNSNRNGCATFLASRHHPPGKEWRMGC